MAGNSNTEYTTIGKVMSSHAFRRGFKEVLRGEPLNSDNIAEHYQWDYERGRLFAAATGGKIPLRINNRTSPDAARAFNNLVLRKDIF